MFSKFASVLATRANNICSRLATLTKRADSLSPTRMPATEKIVEACGSTAPHDLVRSVTGHALLFATSAPCFDITTCLSAAARTLCRVSADDGE